MKKIYVFMTALMAMFANNAKADRILFLEDYEAGGTPSTWTINGGTGSIAGDEEGKYLSFALGQNNGRSAHCLWGESVYDAVKESLTEYSVSFDFQFQAFGNNQYNGEIAVFSGASCPKKNGAMGSNYDDFSTVTSDCLFSLTQNDGVDNTHWFFNGNKEDVITPEKDQWYTLVLKVNTATREVTYALAKYEEEAFKTGTKTLSGEANIYASGLYIMDARYWSVTNVDNVKISIPGEYANTPSIALTGLNQDERTYTIKFYEGETLHVTNTDGTKKDVDYNDCNGKYSISTKTSGTISAYTTTVHMTSETATMAVVCEPIVLPVPTYGIIAADEGYSKTYSFKVDNANVEMQPVIFIDLKFEGTGGTVLESKNNQMTATFSVPSKGKLTVTTKDLNGYYANGTLTITNDIEYSIKHDIDIQHITAEQLIEKGFEKMDDLNSGYTSGESNWTARMRHAFGIATGEKQDDKDVCKYYAVYGPDANGVDKDGNTLTQDFFNGAKCDIDGKPAANFDVVEPIQRYRFLQSKLNSETAYSLFAPMYVWYGTTGVDKSYYEEDGVTPKTDPAEQPGGTTNLQVKLGIGIVFSGQVNDAENYNPNSISYSPILINTTYMGVDGLTDDDLIVVSKIDNYGGGSVHPIFPVGTDPVAAKNEYKAMHLGTVNSTCKGTETFELYRVQDALNRVLVLSPKNVDGIDNMNYNKVVSDHNAPVYNMNGVRMNMNSLNKGVYVKQGKKFVIK